MKKILVTGANGQLGSELAFLAKDFSQFEWVFVVRNELTLNDLDVLQVQLKTIAPDIILNCAAYTAVDKAESESDLANVVNHLAVEQIAKYAYQSMVKLIHVSTDYVFDGTSSISLNEESSCQPINIYGITKRAGEIACIAANPDAIILRTSWVYSIYGSNFVKVMQRLMQDRDTLNVVNDQVGSPTYAADLAEAMITIVTAPDWIPGIYNYSNEGEISWYEFALAIQEIGGYSCEIKGIPSSEYPTAAARPAYSLLDKTKIKSVYGILPSEYKVSLKKMMQRLPDK